MRSLYSCLVHVLEQLTLALYLSTKQTPNVLGNLRPIKTSLSFHLRLLDRFVYVSTSFVPFFLAFYPWVILTHELRGRTQKFPALTFSV